MSCADVCINEDDDYDDLNEFFTEKIVKARVHHECCECKRVIFPDELYETASGKSESNLWRVKTCAECAEIRKTFVCGSYTYGHLWSSIRNGLFPHWLTNSPIDCLAKIESLSARNKLRKAFDEWKEDR